MLKSISDVGPLFFDREELRRLRVDEALKKKLYRLDKEARDLLGQQQWFQFISQLWVNAEFYVEKIAPLVRPEDQKLSLRLEFLLWQELQCYGFQFADLVEKAGLAWVLKRCDERLLEMAARLLTLQQISFKQITIRDFVTVRNEADYAALEILPCDNSIPGKWAKRLSEEADFAIPLCYSPSYTGAKGWAGKYTARALYVSSDFLLDLDLDPDTGHELCHWRSQEAIRKKLLSPFHGDVLCAGRALPEAGAPGQYDGGFEFDELEAFGYNMLVGPERLKRARNKRHAAHEVFWLMTEAQTGERFVKGIQEILSAALSTLQTVFRRDVPQNSINFTSDCRSNADPRAASFCAIGPSLDHRVGFQLTDFKKPGTEYVRGMVFSEGWLIGVPILEEGALEKARSAANALKNQASFFQRVIGKRRVRMPEFFFSLKSSLVTRFEKQRELAGQMEKDFSKVAHEAKAYLQNQESGEGSLLRALEQFSRYSIELHPTLREEMASRKYQQRQNPTDPPNGRSQDQ